MNVLWQPWPGPQTAFCQAGEFEVLYGGAKGPGKSDGILAAALQQIESPAYKALILRHTFPELTELIDRSHRLFPRLQTRPAWTGDQHRWRWPSGASLTFGFCDTVESVQRYQGREWAYIGYDELGKQADERVWTLLSSECRCPDPTVVRMMRATGNPGQAGHPWIKRRWIVPCGKDGRTIHTTTVDIGGGRVVRLQRRYIPARVTDNPVYANDPAYMAQLLSLPDVLRRQLLYGDWDAGTGMALDELEIGIHLVERFTAPTRWTQFGAFDWGYAHPWVFGWFAVSEDGDVYLLDSVRGRRQRPDEIAERIRRRVPVDSLRYIVAGHDVFDVVRARGENTPTIAETFGKYGMRLARANIARVAGLNNLRHYVAWRGRGPHGTHDTPAFRLLDTPDNRWVFDTLAATLCDPDDPEDALKVDADPMSGEGGDDAYDMVRYALASRPPRALSAYATEVVRAFAPAVLQHEFEQGRRRMGNPAPYRLTLDHPEFGAEL